MDEQDATTGASGETTQITILNRWLIGLVVFIIVWSSSMFFYMKPRPDVSATPPAITLSSNSTVYSNSVPLKSLVKNTNTVNPEFVKKDSYVPQEIVVINYFYVKAIVLEKHGKNYKVMYEDFNRDLQITTIPGDMLLSPTSAAANPFSPVEP